MDPISISASLVTLLRAVDTVSKSVQRLSALKHAPRVLQRLNSELSDFHLAIAAIEEGCRQQEALRSESYANQGILSAAIRRAKDAILDLEKLIAYSLLKIPNHKDPQIDLKSWSLAQNKVRDMRQRLRYTKLDILIAFNVDEMQAFLLSLIDT